MNQNLSDVTVILDRSGSMGLLQDPTISGYNEFKGEQAAAEGECIWTEVQFSSGFKAHEVTVSPTPVGAVRDLSAKSYIPGGMTALYDAIGHTINSVGTRLAAMPEADRPATVMIVITTDGYENSSREFSRDAIKNMITTQQEKYNWQFIFMGANQDAILAAKHLGIDEDSSLSYASTNEGQEQAYKSLSRNLSLSRAYASAGVSRKAVFTVNDRAVQYDQGAVDNLRSDA
jgi:hypothetical protein